MFIRLSVCLSVRLSVVRFICLSWCHHVHQSSGGSKGGARDAPSLVWTKLYFHAVFGKKWSNSMLAPPPLGNPGSTTAICLSSKSTKLQHLSLCLHISMKFLWHFSTTNEDATMKESSWMFHVDATYPRITEAIQSRTLKAAGTNPVKLCQSVNFWLFSHCLVLAT